MSPRLKALKDVADLDKEGERSQNVVLIASVPAGRVDDKVIEKYVLTASCVPVANINAKETDELPLVASYMRDQAYVEELEDDY